MHKLIPHCASVYSILLFQSIAIYGQGMILNTLKLLLEDFRITLAKSKSNSQGNNQYFYLYLFLFFKSHCILNYSPDDTSNDKSKHKKQCLKIFFLF